MEDVAAVTKIRENLSKWEDDNNPLAPLTSKERDSIIELTSGSTWRPSAVSYQINKVTNSTAISQISLVGKISQNETNLSQYGITESSDVKKKGVFDHVDGKIESSQQVSFI